MGVLRAHLGRAGEHRVLGPLEVDVGGDEGDGAVEVLGVVGFDVTPRQTSSRGHGRCSHLRPREPLGIAPDRDAFGERHRHISPSLRTEVCPTRYLHEQGRQSRRVQKLDGRSPV
jgi:hypothetical protein